MNKLSLSRMLSQALMVFFISIATMVGAAAVVPDFYATKMSVDFADKEQVHYYQIQNHFMLFAYLRELQVISKNNAWTPDVYLPINDSGFYSGNIPEGSKVTVKVESDWDTDIHLPSLREFDITLSKSQEKSFILTNGVWRDTSDGNMTVYPSNKVNIMQSDILELLKATDRLEIIVENNRWAGNIYLPNTIGKGKEINIYRTSDWDLNVYDDQGYLYHFEKGERLVFVGLEDGGYSVGLD